jgi:hypothetical protein
MNNRFSMSVISVVSLLITFAILLLMAIKVSVADYHCEHAIPVTSERVVSHSALGFHIFPAVCVYRLDGKVEAMVLEKP